MSPTHPPGPTATADPWPDRHGVTAFTGRRRWLRALAGSATAAWLAGCGGLAVRSQPAGSTGGAAAPGRADGLRLAPGWQASVIAAWGDPVGALEGQPPWSPDAQADAEAQAQQVGMHHAGLATVPTADGLLLVITHDGFDTGLLHATGVDPYSRPALRKQQAAVGVSVLALRAGRETWSVQPSSWLARRLTAGTPCRFSGPAAASPWLRTSSDPNARRPLGVLAGSAVCTTPWGTVLVGEGCWPQAFATADVGTAAERRHGLTATQGWGWARDDVRFDTVRHPNEPHRHGWITEFDPLRPDLPPIKRTALGRGVWRGLSVRVDRDGRAVVEALDADGSLYRFRAQRPTPNQAPGDGALARSPLDAGTLHRATWLADGQGRWAPMVDSQDADAGEALLDLRATATRRGGWQRPAGEGLACCADRSGTRVLLQRDGRGEALHLVDSGDGERFTWQGTATLAQADRLRLDSSGQTWLAGRSTAEPGAVSEVWRQGAVAPVLGLPGGARVGGLALAAQDRALFVNVRVPGGHPLVATAHAAQGRPRSATVLLTRLDGRSVGSR